MPITGGEDTRCWIENSLSENKNNKKMKAVQIAAPQKMAVVEIEKPELKAGKYW